jgi:hypothetical protein
MKKVIARTLIFLLMLSNMSFVIATHFCGGSAVSTELSTVISNAHCAMDAPKVAAPCESDEPAPDTCCENSIVKLQIENDFTLAALELPSVFALDLPSQFIFKLHTVATKEIYTKYSAYSPPLPKQKRYISYQVFRI